MQTHIVQSFLIRAKLLFRCGFYYSLFWKYTCIQHEEPLWGYRKIAPMISSQLSEFLKFPLSVYLQEKKVFLSDSNSSVAFCPHIRIYPPYYVFSSPLRLLCILTSINTCMPESATSETLSTAPTEQCLLLFVNSVLLSPSLWLRDLYLWSLSSKPSQFCFHHSGSCLQEALLHCSESVCQAQNTK